MAATGRCSIPPFVPEEVVPGIMFVSGYIMNFSDDGTKGIMSVRGGGNRFVVFNKNDFFINGHRFFPNKRLFDTLQTGTMINVIMKDLGEYITISTFRVRFQAGLCWIGNFPSIPPFVVRNPQLLSNATANENTPPLNTHDIVTDVPIRELQERSGLVYWCCEQYGLISVKEKGNHIENVLFTPRVLFLNGSKFPVGENFALLCSDKYFYMYAKKIPLQKVFGVSISFEAVLVWRGTKPNIRLVQGNAQERVPPTPLQYRLPNQHNNRPAESNSPTLKVQDRLAKRGGLLNNVWDSVTPIKENIVSAVYMTGTYQGIFKGCLLYGSPDKATRFTVESFYANGEQLSSMVEIDSHIMRSKTQPILHGYVIPLKRHLSSGKFIVVAEALYVWHGPAPTNLKEKIKALRREPTGVQSSPVTAQVSMQKSEEENMVDRADLVRNESISVARPIKRGRVSGYVLTSSSSDAVLTGFTNTVHFTRERFYVNGRKFRGTSLLEYFQKNNEKVFTYLVPMKATKVRGCVVTSKAVCAWVGKDPEELQKLIYNDKKMTNYEVNNGERNEEDCFYYFVGRVKKLGEKRGVMQCDVEGEHVDVSFSVNELYKHGKKVNDKGILPLHLNILMTSRWSVLASYSPSPLLPGVHYTAVAVWHHENQGLLFDEFQNKIPHWHQRLTAGKCDCAASLEKLLKRPYSCIVRGSVTENNGDEIAVGVKDRGLVWLDRHRIWIDGCSCYFSNSDEHRACYVVFADDDEMPLFGWMGQEPPINKSNRSANYSGANGLADLESDSDDEDTEHDDEKYFEDVYEETDSDSSSSDAETSIDLTDVTDPYELIRITTKNSFAPLMRSKASKSKKKSAKSGVRNFCGRHVVGQILSVSNDCAIASWRSVELSGTIFIVVDVNYLFINCVAYSKGHFGEQAWKGRTCNLYINTLRDSEVYGLLEASARATVAWIGTKPVFVPPPGKQKLGSFLTSKIRIAYSDSPEERLKFCSLEHWKQRLEWEHEKQKLTEEHEKKLLEQEKRLRKEAGQQYESNRGSFGDRLRASSQSPPLLAATNGMSRLSVADPAIKVSSRQVLDTMCPSAPAAPQPTIRHPSPVLPERQLSPAYDGTMPSQQEEGLTGRVVELHANLGRLLGPDNEAHYFRPDQFQLHGVSLAGVELYYVLVQDLPVQYSLDAEGRLERAWHGSFGSKKEDVALLILAWCETNLVPEDTQGVLLASVSRLQ